MPYYEPNAQRTMTYENTGSALAIYPFRRGYGYVLFESPGAGADWGVRFIEGTLATRNARTAADIEALLDRYVPDYVILQDVRKGQARRSARLVRLHAAIAHAAKVRAIDVVPIAPQAVEATFDSVGARSKYEIAQAVAREFPPLAHRLPVRRRRAWDAEAAVMAMFDAAALAIAFYGHRRPR